MDLTQSRTRNFIPDKPIELNFHLNGFERFKMYYYHTIGDGNCFFHAILMAVQVSYRQNPERRMEIMKTFRNNLADMLAMPFGNVKDDWGNDVILYDQLSRGELRQIAPFLVGEENVSLPALQAKLRSSISVGLEMIEASSLYLNENIFILDAATQDVYFVGDFELLFSPQRSSIVLLYTPGHYSLVGVYSSKNEEVVSHFLNTHSFIEHIMNRILIKSEVDLKTK